jgi:RNA polymerase sigma-70 factor, ECF subfamily
LEKAGRTIGAIGASDLAERKLTAEEVKLLYHRHGAVLLAYACSFVVDRAIAEDVVHQVFVKLLQGETRAPDAPLGYLYRAVRNAALNVRRNVKREVQLHAESAWFAHRGGDQEAAMALQAALLELPEEQREVVMMRVWSGMTLEEIASTSGVSLNTVASRYRYALEKLRERLRPSSKSRGEE